MNASLVFNRFDFAFQNVASPGLLGLGRGTTLV